MKLAGNVVVALMLGVTSFSVSAAWTEVLQTSTSVFYVDLQSIRRDGNQRTYWWMINHKHPDDGVSSARMRSVFDCKKEIYMDLDFTSFPLPDLNGKAKNMFTPPAEWRHVPPQTIVATLMRWICA